MRFEKVMHSVAETRREWVDDMTDVVVKIELNDSASESKLFEAVDQFALNRRSNHAADIGSGDAPDIMIKTIPDGTLVRKSVIFQDRQSAEEFLYFWRRVRRAS